MTEFAHADLTYEVSFKGAASDSLRSGFSDSEVRADHGLTVVRCAPAFLATVLEQLESLGLELLEVRLLTEPR